MLEGSWFKTNGPVPASVLRKMARASSKLHDGDKFLERDEQLFWEVPWEQWLGLPITCRWSPASEGHTIPSKVLHQLIGQVLGMGIRFTHKGKECYAIAIDVPEKEIGDTIEEGDLKSIPFIHGVETKFIDMKA